MHQPTEPSLCPISYEGYPLGERCVTMSNTETFTLPVVVSLCLLTVCHLHAPALVSPLNNLLLSAGGGAAPSAGGAEMWVTQCGMLCKACCCDVTMHDTGQELSAAAAAAAAAAALALPAASAAPASLSPMVSSTSFGMTSYRLTACPAAVHLKACCIPSSSTEPWAMCGRRMWTPSCLTSPM